MNQNVSPRRPRAFLSTLTTNHLHLRNPWVVSFFAFSYPGFGNLMHHRHGKALILILWEVFINHQAKVNLGIMYSMQGHFEKAKQVLDTRWLILYLGIYMFAIWDSYRSTIDLNKLYLLADREDVTVPPVNVLFTSSASHSSHFCWQLRSRHANPRHAMVVVSAFYLLFYLL
ncbi:hypothetical protein LOK74_14505 [Brevibacillus humidisoli]|uniref:hypothetical protein n=1 Tax=Brevibacillus humidisoli TaxID=2895522 RepID=UPI001E3A3EAF|nr:hypothetical protein [Brevibacillus humidisoli]UFJ39282.1 hypothetical protein LOK74_14505 [Brevibacillus humidisoli]